MKPSELRDIIDEIQEKENKTLTEIAAAANLNRAHLSKILNSKSDNPITPGMIRKISKKYPIYFEESVKNDKTNNGDDTRRSKKEPLSVTPIENALLIMAESLKVLADSDKIKAENTRSLTKSHEELISILKEKDKATENVSKEMLEAVGAKMLALQEFVIGVSTKKTPYHSPEEARAALGRKTIEMLKAVGKM